MVRAVTNILLDLIFLIYCQHVLTETIGGEQPEYAGGYNCKSSRDDSKLDSNNLWLQYKKFDHFRKKVRSRDPDIK